MQGLEAWGGRGQLKAADIDRIGIVRACALGYFSFTVEVYLAIFIYVLFG